MFPPNFIKRTTGISSKNRQTKNRMACSKASHSFKLVMTMFTRQTDTSKPFTSVYIPFTSITGTL